MKHYIINIKRLLHFILVIALAGCTDYLNETKPNDKIQSTNVYTSRSGVEAYLSGIYRMFRGQYVYSKNSKGANVSTTDVGGIYSMYFARTIKGTNLIQKPSWFLFDYAHTNREPTYRRVRITWQFLYDLIDHANFIIEGVSKSKTLNADDKKDLGAHAKALRAFFYFQLALEYQHGYAKDPNLPAPPIYKTPNTLEPKKMSTMKEMYEFILADINEATTNLSTKRLSKSYINKNIANGLKARILMAMNKDWDKVEEAAKIAYGGNVDKVLDASSYQKGFNDIGNKEWIWGMDQQGDQTSYYYTAPHAFMDQFARGYLATFVDSDFVSKFTATDVRNTFVNKFTKLKKTHWAYYVTKKFKFAFTSDIPLMRTAEMILAESEALYHQGKTDDAHTLLYKLQKNRDPKVVKSNSTGDDLLNEILLERRKELYGEMGVEWFDAKRLQRGMKRSNFHRVKVDLKPNDNRFYLKIPQEEIDANPNIDQSINNDR